MDRWAEPPITLILKGCASISLAIEANDAFVARLEAIRAAADSTIDQDDVTERMIPPIVSDIIEQFGTIQFLPTFLPTTKRKKI